MSRVGIVIHRGNGDREVPDSLGVDAVDGDGKNFVAVGNLILACVRIGRHVVSHGVAALVGKGDRSVHVSELDTRNILVFAGAGVGGEVLLHFVVGDIIGEFRGGRSPVVKNFVEFAGHIALADDLDSLFFCHSLDLLGRTGRIGKFAFLSAPGDKSFVVKEHFHVGCEKIGIFGTVAVIVDLVELLLLIEVERVRPVGLEFFVKEFHRLVEVGDKVSVSRTGIFALIIDEKFAETRGVDIIHVVLRILVLSCDLVVRAVERADTVARLLRETLGKALLLVLVARLRAVFLKTHDIGRVNGAGTGVHGVEVYVIVKENVLDGEVRTVGVTNVILYYEIISRGVRSAVGYDTEVFGHYVLVLAVSVIARLVVADHADLGKSHDVAVGSRSREERVKNLIYFLRGKYERRGFVVELVLFALAADQQQTAGGNGKNEHQRYRAFSE